MFGKFVSLALILQSVLNSLLYKLKSAQTIKVFKGQLKAKILTQPTIKTLQHADN